MKEIITNPLELIKSMEGCVLKGYKDSAGYLTIGWGHKVLSTEPYKLNKAITQEEADKLLDKDFSRVAKAVNAEIHIDLNVNQTSALISLAFNIGLGAFGRSTLLQMVNTNRLAEAAEQFLRWEFTGGVKNRILELRRMREKELFLLPV